MKLYTINATPWQAGLPNATNNVFCDSYAKFVSGVLYEHGIDGFTFYEVVGFWEGEQERSFKIEIARDDDENENELLDICDVLRKLYNQDSVMLTYPDNTVVFIDGK